MRHLSTVPAFRTRGALGTERLTPATHSMTPEPQPPMSLGLKRNT